MAILFSDIYTKSIALFDDPKITVAYETNKIQFYKLMYTYMQNAIALFSNPSSIAIRLGNYKEPIGTMEVFESDGLKSEFYLDENFELLDNSIYCFIEGQIIVEGQLDRENRIVKFPDVMPEGNQYAFEQYYIGEFCEDFNEFNGGVKNGNNLIVNQIKDILARLLVKSWGEGERNLLLDIRNLMQDSDFKITGNDKILKAKNAWIDQLDTEVLQLQNKLSWNIRFMDKLHKFGRG